MYQRGLMGLGGKKRFSLLATVIWKPLMGRSTPMALLTTVQPQVGATVERDLKLLPGISRLAHNICFKFA